MKNSIKASYFLKNRNGIAPLIWPKGEVVNPSIRVKPLKAKGLPCLGQGDNVPEKRRGKSIMSRG